MKTEVVRHKNKNQFVMYPCLEMQVYCFCVGIFHEISLHKNNSPASPDKNTPLTDSCYNTWVLLVLIPEGA